MTDELRVHWTLHEVDEVALRHETELARHPEQRRVLESRVQAVRQKLQALDARAADLQKRRRDREREVESLLEQERRFHRQRDAVTTQQQFEAIQHEIAAVHGKRSDLETEVLTLMEGEEAATAERPELLHALEKAETETRSALEALAAGEASARGALAALERRRAEALAGLPPAAQQRYQRIRGSRAGRAVAAIEKQACGACFRGLSPHAVQEAKRRETLLVCDGCGRLMLLPPDVPA